MKTDEVPDAVLETERLVLRELTFDDVGNLSLIFSDPEAMRYYPSTKTREQTERWISWVRDSYAENGFGLWACVLKGSGEFVGECGIMLQEVEGRREAEIGYHVLRESWGKGLASEAATACRDYGFERLGYERLISLINPRNISSRRVAEKAGMKLEKEIYWRGNPTCVYSTTR